MPLRPCSLSAVLSLFVLLTGALSGCGSGGSPSPGGSGNGSGGTAAAVTLSAMSLSFTALAGSSSAVQAVTVTNSGGATLSVGTIAVSGSNSGSFPQTSTCGSSLAPNASCTVSITFNPGAAGSFSALLSIADNASGSPQTVTLSGTGTAPALTLSSTSLSFVAPAGSTSATQVVLLSNTGTAALTITAIATSGTGASGFGALNSCGTSLAAGANCTISVFFSPSAATSYTASIGITDNASGSPQSIALSGAGTAASAPVLSLSLSSLSFNAPAESSSAAQTVTLTNIGSAALSISGIAEGGANAGNFKESDNCGATLAVNAACTISATFNPYLVLPGGYSANIAIASNAKVSPASIALTGTATGTLAIDTSNAKAWTISTGAINLTWNSLTGNLVSVMLAGSPDQLVDTAVTSNGQPDGLYMDNTGTGSATPSATYTQAGNEYIDWSITFPSSATNPFTWSEHLVVTANDPGLHVYYTGAHSATDVAGSLGQIQYVFRISQTFNNTYSNDSGLNNLGPALIPLPASQYINSTDPGRSVSNAVVDLHGFPAAALPAGFTRQFYTKYDYSTYEYLHREHGLYGATYGAWLVLPSTETMSGGPTKQDLIFTGNILIMEAQSSHLDNNLGYTPPQGVATTRLFGPYNFEFNKFDATHTTPASLYQEAAQYLPFYRLLYDNDTTLVANTYTPSSARGTVVPNIAAGGSPTANAAWTVLSDVGKNFQYSSSGYQYWANQVSTTSAAATPLTGVVPGTYRLSDYVLGQWGEMRSDSVVVKANQTTTLPATTFVPENFGSAAPVFTIGTPDRSAHEFLHGANAAGQDDREFWGAWNYWSDFAASNGLQVFYATPEGSTPVSSLAAINYVQWGTFNPGLYGGVYNASDDTTDGYTYIVPSYIGAANVATARSPGLAVHFTTTAAQQAQGQYAVLSIGVAAAEGSIVPTLNGTQLVWHYINPSDAMVRSGLAGYYQWIAFQYPASLLKPPGQDNLLQIGVSQVQGVMIDAMRLEITNTSADPSVTGWNDYEFVSSSKYTPANDALPNP